MGIKPMTFPLFNLHVTYFILVSLTCMQKLLASVFLAMASSPQNNVDLQQTSILGEHNIVKGEEELKTQRHKTFPMSQQNTAEAQLLFMTNRYAKLIGFMSGEIICNLCQNCHFNDSCVIQIA